MPFGRRFLIGTGGLDHLPDAFCPENPLAAPAHPTRSPKYLPPRGASCRPRYPTETSIYRLSEKALGVCEPIIFCNVKGETVLWIAISPKNSGSSCNILPHPVSTARGACQLSVSLLMLSLLRAIVCHVQGVGPRQ